MMILVESSMEVVFGHRRYWMVFRGSSDPVPIGASHPYDAWAFCRSVIPWKNGTVLAYFTTEEDESDGIMSQ